MSIKYKEFRFIPQGFHYAHQHEYWRFYMFCRLYNFKFGVDWLIECKQLKELSISLGFFSFNWVKIYTNKKQRRKR